MIAITPDNPRIAHPSGTHDFLGWLDSWLAGRPVLDLQNYMAERSVEARNIAVVSADLVEGFCYHGNLASPRVAGVVGPGAALFSRARTLGVHDFALVQEYHTHDALEFEQFGPHCIGGTDEARTVETLAQLPFADLFTVIAKNTLHPAIGTGMDAWLEARPRLSHFLIVGDCTDLCVYQLMMYLKLTGNAKGRRVDVIVPADCVQTYDLPVQQAQRIGALPHDGDLMHALFLYHMALNGAEIVRSVI